MKMRVQSGDLNSIVDVSATLAQLEQWRAAVLTALSSATSDGQATNLGMLIRSGQCTPKGRWKGSPGVMLTSNVLSQLRTAGYPFRTRDVPSE